MRFTLSMLAFAVIAAPVAAATVESEEIVTVRVAYGDLDVTSTEGRAVLQARIDAKLRKACTVEGISRYSNGRSARDADCIAEGRTAALAEVERVAAAEARRGRAVAAN